MRLIIAAGRRAGRAANGRARDFVATTARDRAGAVTTSTVGVGKLALWRAARELLAGGGMPLLLWSMAVLVPLALLQRRRTRTQARAAAQAELEAALLGFFAGSGYRYRGVDGGAEAQLREYRRREAQATAGSFELELVREREGRLVRHDYRAGYRQRFGKELFVLSCSWSTALERPPRCRWQAADRALDAVGRKRRERSWNALYAHKVASGDAELDARLVFYADDAAALATVLATPGLKEALLALDEVDLHVDGEQVLFADPLQKNLQVALDAAAGAGAPGFGQPELPRTIAAHDRIATLLAVAARASR